MLKIIDVKEISIFSITKVKEKELKIIIYLFKSVAKLNVFERLNEKRVLT